MTVIFKLARGERPKKPKEAVQLGLTDPIWATVEMCWKVQPSDRLTAAQVLKIWENEINGEGIPEAAEQRDHPTVAQVLEIQKETNGGSIPKEAEEGDRFAAVQTLEVQEEISGGIPKTTEQGERRRLRIVRGFRARKSAFFPLRLPWLIGSTPGKSTSWWRFVCCGGSDEQRAQ